MHIDQSCSSTTYDVLYLNKDDEVEDHGEVVESSEAHFGRGTVRGSVGEEGPQFKAGRLVHRKHRIDWG